MIALSAIHCFSQNNTTTFSFFNFFFNCKVITEYVNIEYSMQTIIYQKLHHFSGEKLLIPLVTLLIYSEYLTSCRFIG